MQKVRIGVLTGGKSREREVSFNSGRTICDHLDTACYDIIPLYQCENGTLYVLPWSFLHRGKTTDFEHRLIREAQKIKWDDLKKLVDLIYIAMHGRLAEDGTMQGMLELFKIPYVGSKVLASALGMDKIMQKKFLHIHGISTPRDIIIQPYESLEGAEIYQRLSAAGINFPCIVKPSREGSSLGISIVHAIDELVPSILHARSVSQKNAPVLIEEKIIGMEFSCIVITDIESGNLIPLMPTEIVPDQAIGFFDYEQKYMPGRSVQFTPARCNAQSTQAIQSCAVAVCHALDFCNSARIDGFLSNDGRVIITDPNSFSGASPSSFLFKQAAEYGFNHTQLINHLIKTELSTCAGERFMPHSEKNSEKKNKIRVAVLLGGDSNEREISLESGRNVIFKLSPQLYEPIPLFVNSSRQLFLLNNRLLVSSSTQEIEKQLENSRSVSWHELTQIADFVFIALHGGVGENGCIQGMLELLEMPYNGSSVIASSLCMDKYKTNRFLQAQGLDVPRGFLVLREQWMQERTRCTADILHVISTPCIVKPHDDGCSVLVAQAKTVVHMQEAIDAIFATGKTHALVEELITGIELTGGVIGNDHPRALPPSQAIANGGILSIEEKFLPGAGENQTPAPLAPEILIFVQQTLEKVYSAIGCKGYARIDCFYQPETQSPTGKQRLVILEINTLPGLTPATCIFHQAAEIGLKPMEFIDLIIKLGLQEHSAIIAQQSNEDAFLNRPENQTPVSQVL